MENLIFLIAVLGFGCLSIYNALRQEDVYYPAGYKVTPQVEQGDVLFHGNSLTLSGEDLHGILNKRNHYYRQLDPDHQELFRERLQKFISCKTFIIKDDEAYREMPVLVSAAAIQLCFGLKNYLLPFYKYIRIFPEEYFGDHLKVLAGNVQGRTITVAWNHFLKGYEHPGDGSNVGLHEMSHALYFQNIEAAPTAKRFHSRYKQLLSECYEAHAAEVKGHKDLYSDYAQSHLQEFWAESVELFFEKPLALYSHYPDVYEAMRHLLNQDPQYPAHPIVEDNRTFREKMKELSLARHLLRWK